MIEAASSEEQKTPEYRTRKLESLERQNELIEEENRKREEAKAAKEAKEAKVLIALEALYYTPVARWLITQSPLPVVVGRANSNVWI